MTTPTSVALWHEFAWRAGGPIATMTAITILVLDAVWMTTCLRDGPSAARPVLNIPIEGKWRKFGLIILVGFLVPVMLSGAGVWHLLDPGIAIMLVAGLVAATAVATIAGWKRWHRVGNVAGLVILVLLIAPFALSGSIGHLRYLVFAGLFFVIGLLLFLADAIHRVILGYRPKSRRGVWLRLISSSASALALLAWTAWNR